MKCRTNNSLPCPRRGGVEICINADKFIKVSTSKKGIIMLKARLHIPTSSDPALWPRLTPITFESIICHAPGFYIQITSVCVYWSCNYARRLHSISLRLFSKLPRRRSRSPRRMLRPRSRSPWRRRSTCNNPRRDISPRYRREQRSRSRDRRGISELSGEREEKSGSEDRYKHLDNILHYWFVCHLTGLHYHAVAHMI